MSATTAKIAPLNKDKPAIDRPPISVIVLTFNSEASISRTLEGAFAISDDVHVVDSFSSDRTLEICGGYGTKIVQRTFSNYSDQRNWAIDSLPLKYSWQMHLDADEEITPPLVDIIRGLDLEAAQTDGYILGRKIVFLGRVLRFGGIARTWHYRLFRVGFGRCEDRLYDQHFVASGRVSTLNAFMLDYQEASLSSWTASHNRWSDLEAQEVVWGPAATSEIEAKPTGNRIERRRFLKKRYYALPAFLRAFGIFAYRYILRLGFLDGTPGLIFHVLQGLWFRFLVDAKIFENRQR